MKYILLHLPEWARPTHPVVAYILRRSNPARRQWVKVLNTVLGFSFVGAIFFVSYLNYRQMGYSGTFWHGEPGFFEVIYFPVVIIQIALLTGVFSQVGIVGLAPPTGKITDDHRRAWEQAKVTSHGALLVTRGRWVAVLYRARRTLFLILVVRVALVAVLLVDAALDFDTLRAAVDGNVPGLPLAIEWVLFAFLLGVLVLLPVLATAIFCAFGLWLAVLFPNRAVMGMIQQAFFLGGLFVYIVSLILGWAALSDQVYPYNETDAVRWMGTLVMMLFSDMGLRNLTFERMVALCTRVEYVLLLGPLFVAVLWMEVSMTRRLLRWSAGKASRAVRR